MKSRLTLQQRDEVARLVSMRRGARRRYPLAYIAALYGLTKASVAGLAKRRGVGYALPAVSRKYHWR